MKNYLSLSAIVILLSLGAFSFIACTSGQVTYLTAPLNTSLTPTPTPLGPWKYLGSPGFTSGAVANLSMAFDINAKAYVAYSIYNGASYGNANVVSYNGSSWSQVGSANFSAGGTDFLSLAMNNTTPYLAYQDTANSYKATVMYFNGSSWAAVGTPGFTPNEAWNLCLSIYNSTLYLAFSDDAYNQKASVMTYNGTSWSYLGSPGFSQGDVNGSGLSLYVYNGIPYVAFADSSSGNPCVMSYNGSSWNFVGSADFNSTVIQGPSLAFNQSGTPYLAYEDWTIGDITVVSYNGSTWNTVGNAGLSGLRLGNTAAQLVFSNNTPYVLLNGGNGTSIMTYNGSSWNYVGSPNFTGATTFSTLALYNGHPCVAFQDWSNQDKLSVMWDPL